MNISKKSRRTFLKYLSGSLVGLPLYRTFMDTGAFAQSLANKKRALFIYYPTGVIPKLWFPSGEGSEFQLPDKGMSTPLKEIQNDLVMFSGLNTVGPTNHGGGPRQTFAGHGKTSLDHFFAQKIGKNSPVPRVDIGLATSTAKSADGTQISWNNGRLVKTRDNPIVLFDEYFGNFYGKSLSDQNDILKGRKRIIDYVKNDIKGLEAELGHNEKIIFQSHVSAIDELQKEIIKAIENSDDDIPIPKGCQPNKEIPKLFSKLDQTNNNWPGWNNMPKNIPAIATINRKMMVQAFACGITDVGLLQYGASNTGLALNFEGMEPNGTAHHSLSHAKSQAFINCQSAIMKEIVHLVKDFKNTPSKGNKTIFDETLIFVSTCLGDPNAHTGKNIGCFLTGSCGGDLKRGRYLKYKDTAYNHLLVAVSHLLGATEIDHVGNDKYKGPLEGVL